MGTQLKDDELKSTNEILIEIKNTLISIESLLTQQSQFTPEDNENLSPASQGGLISKMKTWFT